MGLAERPEGGLMCSVCRDLERALESRNVECVKVLSGPYCRFSNRFMAYSNVEMERAKSDLEVHRSLCVSAIREGLHVTPPSLNKNWVKSVAAKTATTCRTGSAPSIRSSSTEGLALQPR
jgi:hypothetical protein